RNAAARRVLREALTTSPQELSSLIEQLMGEDLAASTPGVGSPAVTSARGWLEHRSRVQAYPTVVHLSWAIAGALDCLRAGQAEQARARLNIALLQADQMSVDRGSWWAEIALSRLRDEADFLDTRQKLSTRHSPLINKDTSEPIGDNSDRCRETRYELRYPLPRSSCLLEFNDPACDDVVADRVFARHPEPGVDQPPFVKILADRTQTSFAIDWCSMPVQLINWKVFLVDGSAELVFDATPGSFDAFDGPVLVGLSSLAMGDSRASRACFSPASGFAFDRPRHDDLIILQRCLARDLELYRASPGLSERSQRLRMALDAYDRADLRFSPKKTSEDQSRASFWGVDCCGTAGLVRANPSPYWALVLITTRVMQLGLATRSLLESLLGSWVSVFILRRRLLCLADLCFQAVRHGEPQTVLRLSPELLSELATFVLLGHTAVLDLRARSRSHHRNGRFKLVAGAWTRLLTPPSAWLREHDLLPPESELPGDMQFEDLFDLGGSRPLVLHSPTVTADEAWALGPLAEAFSVPPQVLQAQGSFSKVAADNLLNQWILRVIRLASSLGIFYCAENPDTSYFWRMPGWEDEASASSRHVFRADMCQFGCFGGNARELPPTLPLQVPGCSVTVLSRTCVWLAVPPRIGCLGLQLLIPPRLDSPPKTRAPAALLERFLLPVALETWKWEAVEPTVHRTPLPEPLLRAMVTVGWLRGLRRWAGCALLAFYGMARVGEVLKCERHHLLLRDDLFPSAEALFLRLDTSKTATRGRPKVQHIRIDDPSAMELITIAFKDLQPAEPLFPLSPSAFRSRWDHCLRVLGGAVLVTPGSLRGGGAVSAYHRGVPIQDIQWKLRLKHMATLEHYLQEVAALGALNEASDDAKRLIRFALQLYPCLRYSA
ncbi:unnamed protein product, partial [Symbiodinium necroappetens]